MLTALCGGAGKTTLTLGLIRAWRRAGKRVAPFKKGPDYIDAGWLSSAANSSCYNLDPFLMSMAEIFDSFVSVSSKADIAVLEGNRGLFDGIDANGTYSSAELAKALRSPVILIVDATKTTRTAAAMVLGCQMMDPEVNIAGVILNKVANSRHDKVLRESIEKFTKVPVLGSVPKLKAGIFPERHMGLVTSLEHGRLEESIDAMADVAKENIEIEEIRQVALNAPAFYTSRRPNNGYQKSCLPCQSVTVAVVQDSAFQFYYPENIQALRDGGAHVISVNALEDMKLPNDIDGLYIGGGFPETHAKILSNNSSFRESVKNAIEAGLPVYAECGGLMYLCEGVIWDGNRYPMVGSIPAVAVLEEKPQGHGYTILEVKKNNPFFPVGSKMRGHEFHYSRLIKVKKEKLNLIFDLKKGRGIQQGWDGVTVRNTLATYTHLHARSSPLWADSFLKLASWYSADKKPIVSMSDLAPSREMVFV